MKIYKLFIFFNMEEKEETPVTIESLKQEMDDFGQKLIEQQAEIDSLNKSLKQAIKNQSQLRLENVQLQRELDRYQEGSAQSNE